MEKILAIQIKAEDGGYTVGSYLREAVGLSQAQIRSLKFRENGITVNGARVRVTHVLQAGDILRVCLEKESNSSVQLVPVSHPFEKLYEDEDMICVWKPAGVVTHPSHGHYQDTMVNYLHAYFEQKKENVQIRGIGRLDRDTSGILVFAKNKVAAARLWEQQRQGIYRKEYLALCEGTFSKDAYGEEQTIEEPIGKMPEEKNKMCVTKQGKPAVTHFYVLQPDTKMISRAAQLFDTTPMEIKKYALVQVHLETGRTHQIRVHLAHLEHPLVGDAVYGNGVPGQTYAKLCAWKAELKQPFSDKRLIFIKM